MKLTNRYLFIIFVKSLYYRLLLYQCDVVWDCNDQNVLYSTLSIDYWHMLISTTAAIMCGLTTQYRLQCSYWFDIVVYISTEINHIIILIIPFEYHLRVVKSRKNVFICVLYKWFLLFVLFVLVLVTLT